MTPFDYAGLEEPYNNATAQTKGDYEDVPDGNYQVKVESVKMKETKESRLPMLTWEFKIIAGEHAKRKIFKNDVLDPDSKWINEKMTYLKTDLSTCGVTLDSIKDIESVLDKLLDVNLEITVKSKGEYQNVYINRKLESSVNADDIPF
jgi:hypothetical protein